MDPLNTNMENSLDGLLVKYLLGEAGEEERREVEDWASRSEENKKYFEDFKLIWDRSRQLQSKSTVNEDEAWARFKKRVSSEATPVLESRVIDMPKPKYRHFSAAALILVLIGLGWLAWFLSGGGSGRMIALNAGDSTLTKTLPDGSVVTLNRHAVFSYPEHFRGDERLVTLEGEAFFDVARDKKHPFIIKADDVRVRVVGTSFNVNASEAKTEVIVATGIVEVSKNKYTVALKPHEKAVVMKNDPRPVKGTNTDELYNFYKTRELVCNGTPLWRVVEVLNQAYGAQIVIANPDLRDQPLSTTFHDQPLDNILRVIAETFNARLETKGSQILIK